MPMPRTDSILTDIAARLFSSLSLNVLNVLSMAEEADMLSFLDLMGHTMATVTVTATATAAAATTATLNLMPNDTLKPELYNSTSTSIDNCSICLEDFTARDMCCRLECTHLFHADCVARWLEKQASCPLCRTRTVLE